jgi:hypothetical protein
MFITWERSYEPSKPFAVTLRNYFKLSQDLKIESFPL